MHRRAHGLALAAATLLVLGCDAPEQAPADTDTPGAASDAAADFVPVNRSDVTGTVRADHGDDGATLTLTLSGLEAGTEYPAHIHTGRCAAGGPVAVPLGRVTGGADGAGRLTTRVAASQLDADQPAFVQVHGPGGAAVSCADLGGHERAGQPLTERMDTDSVTGGDGGA